MYFLPGFFLRGVHFLLNFRGFFIIMRVKSYSGGENPDGTVVFFLLNEGVHLHGLCLVHLILDTGPLMVRAMVRTSCR